MSVKKLANGKYFLYTVDSRERKVRLRFDKKEDAEALEAMIRKEKYEQKLARVGLRKTRHVLAECLEDFRLTKTLLQPKSVQKYNMVIKQFRYFCEKIGVKYIEEFASEHSSMYYNELIKIETRVKDGENVTIRSAPKTINFYIQTVKAFFQDEVAKDHIMKSPMLHIRNVKVPKKRPDFYTIEELKLIFSHEMPLVYRNFFLGLLYSGMRFAEAANLTWDNIDFGRRILLVKPQVGFNLKTESSERAIPMTQELLYLLETIFKTKKSNYVFVTEHGTQIRERKALSICKDIAKKAGVNSRAFLHKFRATYATLLIRNKVSLESIKELLGHSSVTMTESAYANNDSAGLHAEVAVLDQIFK